MSGIWILVPLILLGILVSIIVYLIRKRSRPTEDARSGSPDGEKIVNDSQSLSVQPIKIERKKKPKNILKLPTDDPSGSDHEKFLEEFDKRDARRKKLQKENEEKLKSLLNWKSPDFQINKNKITKKGIRDLPTVETRTKREKQDNIREERQSNVKGEIQSIIKGESRSDIKRETQSNIKRASKVDIRRENQTDVDGSIQSRKKDAAKLKCESEEEKKTGGSVSKIINFVKITTQPAVPDYRPRNNLTRNTVPDYRPRKTVDIPQKVERKRRAPTPLARKKVKVNLPQECEVWEKVEDVACLDVPSPEERRASVEVTERQG